MPYYPFWFDYVKIALPIAGGVCAFAMKSWPAGIVRGRLKLAAITLVAVGLFFGGISGVLFNSRAPHLAARGVIYNVEKVGGRGSSTKFLLRTDSGEINHLHIDDKIREINDGETAQLTYQDGSHRVLYLRILDGRYAGYEEQSTDGSFGSYLLIVLAPALLLFGIFSFASDREATVPDSDENLKPQVESDVDSQSMLNL